MAISLVLTVIGPDRSGLVESISRTLAEHEASWQESRMARLAGRFAGILRVTVPAIHASLLETALLAHHAEGLSVVVERGAVAAEGQASRSVDLELLGTDRPGIVRSVTEALTAFGINVEQLESDCVRAPMCGGMLFKASARLRVPEGVAFDDLRHALESLADELMVELIPGEVLEAGAGQLSD